MGTSTKREISIYALQTKGFNRNYLFMKGNKHEEENISYCIHCCLLINSCI